MTKFNINITSDTACPFCYLGKVKLEKGIAAHKASNPSDEFNVTWMPYQLNPSAPTPGQDKQQFFLEKFGDPARIEAMHERMTQMGEQNGIHFKYGGKVGNTRDSHRLVALAKSKGAAMQTKVIEKLFASYFENEKDISDHQVLEEAGVNAGLPADEVKALLSSDQFGAEVDKEILSARNSLISGVPYFVIQDQYEIQGAQEAETFRRVFGKVKELES